MKKSERRFCKIMFFEVLIVVVLLICTSLTKYKTMAYEPYIVKQGDTLWGIAQMYKPADMRYDKYIYELKKHNCIGSDICAGQVVDVLVYENAAQEKELPNAANN